MAVFAYRVIVCMYALLGRVISHPCSSRFDIPRFYFIEPFRRKDDAFEIDAVDSVPCGIRILRRPQKERAEIVGDDLLKFFIFLFSELGIGASAGLLQKCVGFAIGIHGDVESRIADLA